MTDTNKASFTPNQIKGTSRSFRCTCDIDYDDLHFISLSFSSFSTLATNKDLWEPLILLQNTLKHAHTHRTRAH